MTTEETKPGTMQGALEALAAALVLKRRDDGTEYRSLSDAASSRALSDGTEISGDDLLIVVRECHLGELPNDWRYGTIHDLCQRLLEYSQPDSKPWDVDDYEGILPEVAEALTEYGTSRLLSWLADCPERCEFYDYDVEACGRTSIADLAQARQREEIEVMGRELLHSLDNLLSA